MKTTKLFYAYLVAFALVFTSCSKDEGVAEQSKDKATLSFTTVLNDLVNNKAALKQELSELPDCSDDAPAYVEVVLSGTEAVGTMENPLVVAVNPTPGNYDADPELEFFTEESTALELEPGAYTLEYFAVYNGDPADPASSIIWIAPHTGGTLASFVDTTLPMDFNLGAGAKKYLDVEVLCFDNRVVNEYGYLFFDIEEQRAIEFCVFGNYCDENGRHFPAHFRVEVWTYSGDSANPKGTPLFDPQNPYINEVGVNNEGDAYADPLCFPLPDGPGVDRYYGEIYVLEFGDDEDAGRRVVSGVFTDANVRNLFGQGDTVDYYHFRENCEMGNTGF